jgi:hypothetical protein
VLVGSGAAIVLSVLVVPWVARAARRRAVEPERPAAPAEDPEPAALAR